MNDRIINIKESNNKTVILINHYGNDNIGNTINNIYNNLSNYYQNKKISVNYDFNFGGRYIAVIQ